MKQAWEYDVGHSFMWRDESYVVIRHEDDNVIVHRTVGMAGNVIPDHQRFDENFNPHSYVKSVL